MTDLPSGAGAAGTELGPMEDVPLIRNRVYRTLLENIVSGGFRPGDRIIERDIAARLGVSTTPIKEALRRLENEGFVQSLPRRGVVVSETADSSVRDVLVVRQRLEGLAAQLAAERVRARTETVLGVRPATDEEVAALTAAIAAMAEPPDSAVEAALVNEEFHDVVRTMSGNGLIVQMVRTLLEVDSVLRRQILSHPDEIRRGADEHRAVGDAILRGDSVAAEAAMTAHIGRSAQRSGVARG